MPIYEYECNKCGYRLEALQKASEKPLKKCPKCNASTLEKLISASSFQLKGSGWYATDFKSKAKSQEKTKETDTGSNTGDKKVETKPTESKKDKAADK